MVNEEEESETRARHFTARYPSAILRKLGQGVHGKVFLTDRYSAVKVHRASEPYGRERDVYLRLKDRRVTQVRDCAVPQLLAYDDQLKVIEITVVQPPFVLDFAGAYLDRRPDFSDEVLADSQVENIERFGEDWPEVDLIISSLEKYGIFLYDIKPDNIQLS